MQMFGRSDVEEGFESDNTWRRNYLGDIWHKIACRTKNWQHNDYEFCSWAIGDNRLEFV